MQEQRQMQFLGWLLNLNVLYRAQLLCVHSKPLPICLLAHLLCNNVHPPRKAGAVGLGIAGGQYSHCFLFEELNVLFSVTKLNSNMLKM